MINSSKLFIVPTFWNIPFRGGVIGVSNPEISEKNNENPEISEEKIENLGSRNEKLKNLGIFSNYLGWGEQCILDSLHKGIDRYCISLTTLSLFHSKMDLQNMQILCIRFPKSSIKGGGTGLKMWDRRSEY